MEPQLDSAVTVPQLRFADLGHIIATSLPRRAMERREKTRFKGNRTLHRGATGC